MQVHQNRLREDIETNAEFGSIDVDDGRGRTVLTGSKADRYAREYLVEQMETIGMSVRVDPVGNICGRWTPESADPKAAPVASGSHLDSVFVGGIFDGPLGVYGALEAVRAIKESTVRPTRPIEVVSFTEEEGGRFDVGLLGSSVAAGKWSVTEALALEDDDGVTLETYLDDIGFSGDAEIDPGAWDAFFELHIEQGPRLEEAGASAGVVTAINGLTNCEVEITGHTDHASRSMSDRSDALAATSEFVLDVEAAAQELALTELGSAVATVGKMDIDPNARNVVPGSVTLRTDVRAVEYEAMSALVDRAKKSLARIEQSRDIETSLERYRDQPPTPMTERCREVLHEGAQTAGVQVLDIHSGGGHDTINVAELTDVALLFAPCRDGISHNPQEWTDWEDCAKATRVLTEAIADLGTR